MTQEEIDALPDSLTIALKTAIKLGDDVYSGLVLREPTAKQLEDASKLPNVTDTITLVALTAGIPTAVAQQLPARVIAQAEAFFTGFLQRAQPTAPSA